MIAMLLIYGLLWVTIGYLAHLRAWWLVGGVNYRLTTLIVGIICAIFAPVTVFFTVMFEILTIGEKIVEWFKKPNRNFVLFNRKPRDWYEEQLVLREKNRG